MGGEEARWRQMRAHPQKGGLCQQAERRNDHEELPAPEFPAKPETRPDRMCARAQLRALLNGAMKTLPPRYQKVVVLYYLREMTMREIGDILGINESRVSQIHKSALEKMGVALEAVGVGSSQAF